MKKKNSHEKKSQRNSVSAAALILLYALDNAQTLECQQIEQFFQKRRALIPKGPK
jgi:hypothetical protein